MVFIAVLALPTAYFSLVGSGGTPGVVSYKDSYDFTPEPGQGDDRISVPGWLAQSLDLKSNLQLNKSNKTKKKIN